MKYILFFFSLYLPSFLFSQNEFDIHEIDSVILKGADAVIRIKEEIFKVKTIGSANQYDRLVVTVFNERGENLFSSFYAYYNKFCEIKKIEGAIYDALGKKVETLKKKDVKDYSAFDPSCQVTDGRQKLATFDKKKYSYPYTLEFSIIKELSNSMFYPTWFPIENEHVGIEKSIFSIIKPPAINFKYKELNIPGKVNIVHSNEEDSYTWALENIKPMEFENYMADDQLPVLFTSANNFEVEAYTGNSSSWKEIGKFNYLLNKDRDLLPENIKQKVKELIQNEPDTLKKVEKLYNYMQSATRYISIQLGIGGWQTMSALDVAQKGYGDCKALSNYMIALLKEAGITAKSVLILAGNNYYKIQEDFPCFQFNHAIACVPLLKDTIWLECTSSTSALGYMGSFTGNRKALVISAEGGVLVNIVNYRSRDNIQNRKSTVIINEAGDADAIIKTTYKGIRQERFTDIIHNLNKEHQKQSIIHYLNIPSFELENFSFTEQKSRIPEVEENLEIKINKIITKTGTTVFITPNLLPDPLYIPSSTGDRVFSFYLNPNNYNYSTSDTITYNVPKEFTLESLPTPVSLKSIFGEYSVTYTFKDNRLIYCRNLLLTGGTFPNTEYKNWISFAKQINKNDKLKVVFALK